MTPKKPTTVWVTVGEDSTDGSEMSCTDGNCVYRTERGGMSTNGGCDCRNCPTCGGVYIPFANGVRHRRNCTTPDWLPPVAPDRFRLGQVSANT